MEKNRIRATARVTVRVAVCAACLYIGLPAAACDLKVSSAWIREPTPGAPSLAAYATLENTGTKTLRITRIDTAAAASAMIHDTLVENGVAKMRMVSDLDIAAGGKLKLAPGGKHLMLAELKSLPKVGDEISIAFADASGCVTQSMFKVRPLLAPAP